MIAILVKIRILTVHLGGPRVELGEQLGGLVLQGVPVLPLRPGTQALFDSSAAAGRLRLTERQLGSCN